MESVIAISVLFLFIIVGVPIAYSLGAASLIYAMLFPNLPNMIVVQRFVRGPDSFELLAIPMFILAGSILNESGATRRLVKFASALVGHFRGGLAQANIVASMIFAGMSGSANADVAGIGRVLIKAQIDEGYDADFSAAITASSACKIDYTSQYHNDCIRCCGGSPDSDITYSRSNPRCDYGAAHDDPNLFYLKGTQLPGT